MTVNIKMRTYFFKLLLHSDKHTKIIKLYNKIKLMYVEIEKSS